MDEYVLPRIDKSIPVNLLSFRNRNDEYMERYNNFNEINENIWSFSFTFYKENEGFLLGRNEEGKIDFIGDKIKKGDNSFIDKLIVTMMKDMVLYENRIIQNWIRYDFENEFRYQYGVLPNQKDFIDWIMQTSNEYSRNKVILNATNYTKIEISMKDILKNLIKRWIYEHKITYIDVPLMVVNEDIKHRLFIVNIDDLSGSNLEEKQLFYHYPNFYKNLNVNKKNKMKEFKWSFIMKNDKYECSKNIHKVFDYLFLGIMI